MANLMGRTPTGHQSSLLDAPPVGRDERSTPISEARPRGLDMPVAPFAPREGLERLIGPKDFPNPVWGLRKDKMPELTKLPDPTSVTESPDDLVARIKYYRPSQEYDAGNEPWLWYFPIAQAHSDYKILAVFKPPALSPDDPYQAPIVYRPHQAWGPYLMETILAHEIAHLMVPPSDEPSHGREWHRQVAEIGYPEWADIFDPDTGEESTEGWQRWSERAEGLVHDQPRDPSIARLALASFPISGQELAGPYAKHESIRRYVEAVYPPDQFDYQTLDLADPFERLRDADPERRDVWEALTDRSLPPAQSLPSPSPRRWQVSQVRGPEIGEQGALI